MKAKKLQHVRNVLIGNMQMLHASAVKTARSMGRDNENYPDFHDRASREACRGFELLLRERENRMLVELREAVERIDQGIFGICKICGSAISEKRLRANPMTTRCIACREKEERHFMAESR
jgi:DnaK suppressor protein